MKDANSRRLPPPYKTLRYMRAVFYFLPTTVQNTPLYAGRFYFLPTTVQNTPLYAGRFYFLPTTVQNTPLYAGRFYFLPTTVQNTPLYAGRFYFLPVSSVLAVTPIFRPRLQALVDPNSKHWFTTSFLQPLPYLVTPQGPENCQLTSSFFLVLEQ